MYEFHDFDWAISNNFCLKKDIKMLFISYAIVDGSIFGHFILSFIYFFSINVLMHWSILQKEFWKTNWQDLNEAELIFILRSVSKTILWHLCNLDSSYMWFVRIMIRCIPKYGVWGVTPPHFAKAVGKSLSFLVIIPLVRNHMVCP